MLRKLVAEELGPEGAARASERQPLVTFKDTCR
jgi:hypothetical protein